MWNKLYIIIDKKSVKPILIWKFSGKDLVIMSIAFVIGYFPCTFLFDELVGMVIGSGLFIIVGFLLVELRNHLSILQHIQMWYKYQYKSPKEYFYIPTSEIVETEKNKVSDDSIEWLEYQEMIKKNRFQ